MYYYNVTDAEKHGTSTAMISIHDIQHNNDASATSVNNEIGHNIESIDATNSGDNNVELELQQINDILDQPC
eukprot:3044886-Ditylum_brightwellii.AAC.1